MRRLFDSPLGISKTAAVDEIKATLSQGDVVILRRFGTFSERAKQARQGRNPKTGEPSEISARYIVRFRPGRQLRAAAAHAPRARSRERKA